MGKLLCFYSEGKYQDDFICELVECIVMQDEVKAQKGKRQFYPPVKNEEHFLKASFIFASFEEVTQLIFGNYDFEDDASHLQDNLLD